MPMFGNPLRTYWRRLLAEQAKVLAAANDRLDDRLAKRLANQDKKLDDRLAQRLDEGLTRLRREFQALIPDLERQLRKHEAKVTDSLSPLLDTLRSLADRQQKIQEHLGRLGREQHAIRRLVQARTPVLGEGVVTETSSHEIPLSPPPSAPAFAEPLRDQAIEMEALDACAVCGCQAHTPVCEYNKLMLLDASDDEAVKRYDYRLCHGCGVAYASRRPVGATYRDLFNRFEVAIGRVNQHPLLTTATLTEEQRALLATKLAAGVFVSEHLDAMQPAHLPDLEADRLACAVHLELIGSLLELARPPRVLEIRPKFGSISAGLRRLYGADVHVLPMTDVQRFVIQRLYGIEAAALLDFDHFEIPVDGAFDLVVANHHLTHALRPAEFLDLVHGRLVPGGHLYLYNECNDAEFLDGNASMINTLNPFHMQAFDRRSMVRALAAHGFETVFARRRGNYMIILASAVGERRPPEMAEKERGRRVAAYLRARDHAILRVPERERWRFKDEWDAVLDRGLASGALDFGADASLRLVKPFKG